MAATDRNQTLTLGGLTSTSSRTADTNTSPVFAVAVKGRFGEAAPQRKTAPAMAGMGSPQRRDAGPLGSFCIASDDSEEPNLFLGFCRCLRSQRQKCLMCRSFGAAAQQRQKSFMQSAARIKRRMKMRGTKPPFVAVRCFAASRIYSMVVVQIAMLLWLQVLTVPSCPMMAVPNGSGIRPACFAE